MGMEAGKRLSEFKQVGLFLVGFGIAMPLIGAFFGLLLGHYYLGYSVGGVTLVTVLAASCSYIAVPPAMRLAIPEANPSFYLTLSLGCTFPFNVVIGIPIVLRGCPVSGRTGLAINVQVPGLTGRMEPARGRGRRNKLGARFKDAQSWSISGIAPILIRMT